VQGVLVFIAIDLANLNLDDAALIIGWSRAYFGHITREYQREPAFPIPPDQGLQITER
jgi:hypothetical protein